MKTTVKFGFTAGNALAGCSVLGVPRPEQHGTGGVLLPWEKAAPGHKNPGTDGIDELKLLATWSGTDSSGILWICLGIGLILILTLFILMVLFKWKHLKQVKEKLDNTDSSVEPNNTLKANTESSVNTEEIRHTLPSETLMYSVEECTCSDCGLVKPQTGRETSFPLPATEERATVLVTTKSFDYCNYVLGVG
ncbi:tumor necrosis factor receptor superfamily member 17 isoform X1 [Oenanthe melanoleuca]|uniref:tumor necrosis factor receptor superfamily member 17 isoform X1 n=1 Tax=Oenanthe melanoleuca TaxID=2939378 RepID=UPI0024C0F06C|nr:tumor necrosis factor receptor superfamily member 17 isoform X1 [Oenanthe melanoleuca]XP_056359195.1 tumor necrosis factor receptor superfamily member 17 isoform X1 [Oenanthe melanoleuca]XP_056359196.1 tumor necrosis factor receptor superfamily member 17 isoform X1 [Oenanthe melanoleuca]